jgi:N-acetylglucosaminyldiphosphoundecaprenol N-acetyl-beta-D-mannosaminyltransferase
VSSLEILGCRLDPIAADDATARIVRLAREGEGAQVVTLGTEMVVHAQRDERFRGIVNASALSLCDTVGLLAIARRRGAALRERVTGVELIEHLVSAAAAESLPIYLLGGADDVATEAARALEGRFPGLRVAGARSGYFRDDETPAIVRDVASSGARILFVGMGSPRQEYWLAEHLRATGCGVGVGVGGSFDVIAGRIARAPLVFRKLALEWLYRLGREPRRWRRQLALPRFVWLVLLEELGIRRGRKETVGS